MSSKKAKLIKRQVSREARAKLGSEIEILKEIFKPRPKWVPAWIWNFGLSLYVKKGEIDFVPFKDGRPSSVPKDL